MFCLAAFLRNGAEQPRAETKTVSQKDPFLLLDGFPQVLCHSSRKLTDIPIGFKIKYKLRYHDLAPICVDPTDESVSIPTPSPPNAPRNASLSQLHVFVHSFLIFWNSILKLRNFSTSSLFLRCMESHLTSGMARSMCLIYWAMASPRSGFSFWIYLRGCPRRRCTLEPVE